MGWRRLFRFPARDVTREVEEEIGFHLDETAAAMERDGLSSDEALREARRRFGRRAPIARECRDLQDEIRHKASVWRAADRAWWDLRLGARTLRRSPIYAVFAVITLALGIGGTSAVASLANGLLLKVPPGVREPSRVVELALAGESGDPYSMSYPLLRRLEESGPSPFAAVAGFELATVVLGDGADPRVVFGLQVTRGYFDVLGTRLAAGRFFGAGDARVGGAPVAVISHHLWREHFSSRSDAVGSGAIVNGTPVTIVGVAEPGFGGHVSAVRADIFLPVGAPIPGLIEAASLRHPSSGLLDVVARLAEDVSASQALAQADAIRQVFYAEHDPAFTGRLRAQPFGAVPSNARLGAVAFFAVLFLLVLTLLLMACANLAALLLARGADRRRDIAVRLSLGATRGALVRQLLAESCLLVAAGGVMGLALGQAAVQLLLRFTPALPLPGVRLEPDFGLDTRVVLASLAVSLAAGLAFALHPALRSTRVDLTPALRGAGAAATPRWRGRRVLLALQAAGAVVLLTSAGLFARALAAGTGDAGFRVEGVSLATFNLELSGLDAVAGRGVAERLLEAVRRLPDVEAAAFARKPPLAGSSMLGSILPEGASERTPWSMHFNVISDGYFEALDIPIRQGRPIAAVDVPGAPLAAVVNETMAGRAWPDGHVLGRVFEVGGRTYHVVGVAADATYKSFGEATPSFAYLALGQHYREELVLHVHTRRGGILPVDRLRAALAETGVAVPVLSYEPLERAMDLRLLPQRVAGWVSAALGIVGLALATIGTVGLSMYAASTRRREIGLRMALGASGPSVTRLLIRQVLLAPAIGIGCGVAAAAALGRILSATLLPEVSPLDVPVLLGVPLTILALTAAATWLPARRAATGDAADTLRAE